MKVVWTDRAKNRLRDIRAYIGHEASPQIADKVVRGSLRQSVCLSWPGMARSGRRVPEFDDPDVLELIVPPYRVIYAVLPQRIDVLTVMRGRQLLPNDADALG